MTIFVEIVDSTSMFSAHSYQTLGWLARAPQARPAPLRIAGEGGTSRHLLLSVDSSADVAPSGMGDRGKRALLQELRGVMRTDEASV